MPLRTEPEEWKPSWWFLSEPRCQLNCTAGPFKPTLSPCYLIGQGHIFTFLPFTCWPACVKTHLEDESQHIHNVTFSPTTSHVHWRLWKLCTYWLVWNYCKASEESVMHFIPSLKCLFIIRLHVLNYYYTLLVVMCKRYHYLEKNTITFISTVYVSCQYFIYDVYIFT